MAKQPLKIIKDDNYFFSKSVILDEKIERVWYFLRNPLFYKEMLPINFMNFKLNKKTKSFCPGDGFSFYWIGVSNINTKFISKNDNPHRKKLILDISINIGIFYRKTYHLYKITDNNKTLLKIVLSKIPNSKCDDENFISFMKLNPNLYTSILDNLNKILNTSKEYLYILESFIADKNIIDSWNIITDFKKLSNLCPSIGTNFSYQNNQYIKGSFVKCLFPKSNKNIFMKVTKCDKNKKKINWVYSLKTFGADISHINQEMQISINKIDDNKTQINILHIFKQILTKEYVENFSKKKKQVINEIKKYLNSKI